VVRPRLRQDSLRGFFAALCMVGFVIILGTVGYEVAEGWGLFESFYQTMIVVSTLGIRQVRDMTRTGEVVTLLLIVGGAGSFAYFFTVVTRLLVEGQLRRVLGRRIVDAKISSLKQHFIVCGYGRMGQTVTDALRQRGLAVVVVDQDAEVTAQAEAAGVPYVRGSAHEEEILQSAGLQRARGVVSVLPTDADNLFVTLTARGLCPDILILTQAEHPRSEAKLRTAGADRVFNPYSIGASRFTAMILNPTLVEFIDGTASSVDIEVQEIEVLPGSPIIGTSLRDSNLRTDAGVQVIAVRQADGKTIFAPPASLVFAEGDIIVSVGSTGSTTRLTKHVAPPG
jgi:voltage-gated potassium channel